MIKSVRIHHTSDGGTLDIGVSDKTVIEVDGVRVSLAALIQVGGLVDVDRRGGELNFIPHLCQKPVPDENLAPKRGRRKDAAEE